MRCSGQWWQAEGPVEISADAFNGLNAYQQREACSSSGTKPDEVKDLAATQACLSFCQNRLSSIPSLIFLFFVDHPCSEQRAFPKVHGVCPKDVHENQSFEA